MTVKVIRRGWGPFTAGHWHSTDGRFRISVIGWDPIIGESLRRADGSRYGYDLHEGDVKLGRFPHVDAAVAEAKNRRDKGRKG